MIKWCNVCGSIYGGYKRWVGGGVCNKFVAVRGWMTSFINLNIN